MAGLAPFLEGAGFVSVPDQSLLVRFLIAAIVARMDLMPVDGEHTHSYFSSTRYSSVFATIPMHRERIPTRSRRPLLRSKQTYLT